MLYVNKYPFCYDEFIDGIPKTDTIEKLFDNLVASTAKEKKQWSGFFKFPVELRPFQKAF